MNGSAGTPLSDSVKLWGMLCWYSGNILSSTMDKGHRYRTHQGLRLEKGRAVQVSHDQGDGEAVLTPARSTCRQRGDGSPDAVAADGQTGPGVKAG